MPCHVPTCPRRVGPSGWCMTHRNRLNARLPSVVRKAATLADLIAIADHPGWRRGHQLSFGGEPGAVVWYARGPGHRMQHATAADALADIDRISGRAPAAAYMARLEAEVSALKVAASVARAERDTARAYADAIRTHRDALEERRRELAADNDLLHLQVDTARWAHADLLVDIIGLRDELATLDADAKKLTAERNAAMRALSDIRVFAHGLLPVPPPSSTPPATLGESALAAVAILIRDRDEIRRDRDTLAVDLAAIRTHRDALEERRRELAADNNILANEVWILRFAKAVARDRIQTYDTRLEVYSAALDRQATDIARLTSELAERERDITYACADRDEYMRERDEARAELTLARRPWWRKVWAWVTGGGS